ncbi:TetR/AcrR family transcriptional regulator [Leptospira congkakensis]|uniref:TetR/AcrR family transcriptional regulator n=1 Tax=Leptospira congkakensis TaxID=2484932 RepID=A0A4Z1ABA6_9LEPT|nr:TetR/AcrR family transcriptional regulator [Leptospira congkakensis]TGL87184.1 TetR/AcrR family transcriptional regulator [Leptospira congkakensis]TGL96752.1 TetR/AcrR family transcriptional regulator [Leptospira congkakensis]TGL97601.1 TetR/AcrR family transcriptional regulator [Leptospira congkakensis]
MQKKKKQKVTTAKLSKKVKKRQTLSKELVLEAAISFADQYGIDELSMRNLALKLGVEAMSLYNHVKNKDDLLDSMVDFVISKITLPVIGANWKDEMKKRARSVREILILHPWATLLVVSRMNVGNAMLTYFDTTLGCLHTAGFSLQEADHIINTIDSHIYGYILQELNFPIEPDEYAKKAEGFLPLLESSPYPYLTNLTKEVIEGKYDGLHNFEFGLNLILDGLKHK